MSEHCLILTSEFPPLAVGGVARYVSEVASRLCRSMRVTVVLVPTYQALPETREQSSIAACCADAVGDSSGHRVEVVREPYREALQGVDDATRLQPLLEAARAVASRCREHVRAGELLHLYVQDYALAPVAVVLRQQYPRATLLAACHLPVYAGFTYFDKPVGDAMHQVLEAMLVHLADRVVVPSRFAAHVLALTHNVPAAKLSAVALGVHRPRPVVAVPAPPLRLLAVGRATEQKGYHFLLAALHRLRRHDPGVRLTIVTGADRCDRVRALADRCGVADEVDLAPAVGHGGIWSLIDRHHLLVTTSLYETFGLAVLEAMASARAAVGFAVGALPELWGEPLSEELGTPVACVDRLVDRIAGVAGDLDRLGKLAQRVEERAREFSWERHVARLTTLVRATAPAPTAETTWH